MMRRVLWRVASTCVGVAGAHLRGVLAEGDVAYPTRHGATSQLMTLAPTARVACATPKRQVRPSDIGLCRFPEWVSVFFTVCAFGVVAQIQQLSAHHEQVEPSEYPMA
jgi:hypothetical protein